MLETILADCPYCGETVELALDCPTGSHAWIEDCWVCCRPIEVRVDLGNGDRLEWRVAAEDDT